MHPPQIFGWESAFYDKPKLAAWYSTLSGFASPVGEERDLKFCEATERVWKEVNDGLRVWQEEKDRWNVLGIVEHIEDKTHKWVYP